MAQFDIGDFLSDRLLGTSISHLYSVSTRKGTTPMAMERTYSQARANLAALCTAVTTDVEVVIIHRRGAEDVALISAAELAGLQETAHLLRSPKNAARLQHALAAAKARTESPRSLDQLRQDVGIDQPVTEAGGTGTQQTGH